MDKRTSFFKFELPQQGAALYRTYFAAIPFSTTILKIGTRLSHVDVGSSVRIITKTSEVLLYCSLPKTAAGLLT